MQCRQRLHRDAYLTTDVFFSNAGDFDATDINIGILHSLISKGDDAIVIQSHSQNVIFQGVIQHWLPKPLQEYQLVGTEPSLPAKLSNIAFTDITVINVRLRRALSTLAWRSDMSHEFPT